MTWSYMCDDCGERVDDDAIKCPYCNYAPHGDIV
jgi:DNA-directed RNA polymerase subunit RPC12/RpoP